MPEYHWFLTVDWCKQGERGLFTDSNGKGFWESRPHTEEEMRNILFPFAMILAPQSLPFAKEDFVGVSDWHSLGEYCDNYGYAILPKDVLAAVTERAQKATHEEIHNA